MKAGQGSASAVPVLTAQERRVCRLLCGPDEPGVKELPAVLGISERTVRTHLEKLYRKLKVRTRVGLVREAIARGLVPCPGARCGGGSPAPG